MKQRCKARKRPHSLSFLRGRPHDAITIATKNVNSSGGEIEGVNKTLCKTVIRNQEEYLDQTPCLCALVARIVFYVNLIFIGTKKLARLEQDMPLFGNTFSPKKTPPRKSASLSNLHTLDRATREVELGLEYGSPMMTLGGQSLKFENGQWIVESGGTGAQKENRHLRKRVQQLEEEQNLLKLKIDILLDMLAETTAESHLMEKELEELKRHSRKRK